MRTLLVPGDRQEMLERLEALRPDSPRQWGRMNSHQMVCHLIDGFAVALGQRTVSPATGLFQRTIMKWGGLYLPIPWPKNIPTRPEIDQVEGKGTAPEDWRRDVLALRDHMQRFVGARQWSPHPIFGRMTASEWMRWGYLHMDHHFRQFGC